MLAAEILLIALVLVLIGYPIFVKPAEIAAVDEGDEYHRLLYARDAAYTALKDLEFDFKTGKIDDEDYHTLKAQFEGEAVGILKKIDDFEKKPKGGKKEKRRS